jgi:hypothetical protein
MFGAVPRIVPPTAAPRVTSALQSHITQIKICCFRHRSRALRFVSIAKRQDLRLGPGCPALQQRLGMGLARTMPCTSHPYVKAAALAKARPSRVCAEQSAVTFLYLFFHSFFGYLREAPNVRSGRLSIEVLVLRCVYFSSFKVLHGSGTVGAGPVTLAWERGSFIYFRHTALTNILFQDT